MVSAALSNEFSRRDAQTSRDKENRARFAFAWGEQQSIGYGEFTYPEKIEFGMAFVGKPMAQYCAVLDDDSDSDLTDTRFPICSGIVYDWDVDGDGNYVGAYVAVVVQTLNAQVPTAEVEPNYTIDHHFTFAGTAYKKLGEWVGKDL